MLCIALRHITCEDLGTFEPILRARFDRLVYVDMEPGGSAAEGLEEAASADLVVSLGGPMAVYEADRYPFIACEIRILRERLARAKPTLGLCLGAQIMAAAAWARVHPGGRREIGWHPIQLAAEAAADPALSQLARDSNIVFQWHGDTFEMPSGSRPIASSALFPHQGFAIGRHGIALQFHAEVDELALEAWLTAYQAHLRPGPGVMSAGEIQAGASMHGPSLLARGRSFLEAWLTVCLHQRA
jgi:GMP synthase (glutamine-hydrolysing)